MKRLIAVLLALLLCGNAFAEVIPPEGMGQIGYEAVVLCQSLTVRSERSTGARAVATLRTGERFATMNDVDGWRDCFLSENGGRSGWVKAEYVVVNPAWYVTDRATPVHAWGEDSAPLVGLLDPGERHPILKAAGEWLVIGLRGASGWIHAPKAAREARQASFAPGQLQDAVRAELMTPSGKTFTLTAGEGLDWIRENFGQAWQTTATKSPYDAVLNLALADGSAVSLTLATDQCNVYRAETGDFYMYGTENGAESSRAFWALFGLTWEDLH